MWYVQERSSYNVTRDGVMVVNDDCPQRRLDVMQMWMQWLCLRVEWIISINARGKAEDGKLWLINHIWTFPAESAPLLFLLDRSIEGGGRADHEFALQMRCANVANAHNVVVMSSQSVRGDNLQIGSLQIDVHEPAVRLSQAVISIQVRDLHPSLVWKSAENLQHPSETRAQLRVKDDIPKCHFIV